MRGATQGASRAHHLACATQGRTLSQSEVGQMGNSFVFCLLPLRYLGCDTGPTLPSPRRAPSGLPHGCCLHQASRGPFGQSRQACIYVTSLLRPLTPTSQAEEQEVCLLSVRRGLSAREEGRWHFTPASLGRPPCSGPLWLPPGPLTSGQPSPLHRLLSSPITSTVRVPRFLLSHFICSS